MIMRMTKKILSIAAAASLAVAMVPANLAFAAPTAIVTYDFENGTAGMSDSGLGGPAPTVVQDATRGNVLQLNGGTGSEYQSRAQDSSLSENSTKIVPGTPSSLKLDTNPYAGKSATGGGTISVWVKAPAAAAEAGAGILGFVSSHKDGLQHPDAILNLNNNDEVISGDYCYGIGVGSYDFALMKGVMLYFGGMLRDTMWLADEGMAFYNNADQWVHMIVTVGNNVADNKVYINGALQAELMAQQLEENGIGKRFNHGELDNSAKENTMEPTIMDILTAADTTAYIGYNGAMAAAEGVCIDDLTYYDGVASAADVMAIYQAASAGGQGGTQAGAQGGAQGGNQAGAQDGTQGGAQGGTQGGTQSSTQSGNKTSTTNKSNSTAKTNTQNLPQTGVVSTGVLVACGAAAVAGGAILFKKKENENENE